MLDPTSQTKPINGLASASHRQCVQSVLQRKSPARIVYAPNYWQWFAHHQNYGLLPPELAHCHTQLDLIRHLGLDVFSRNIYADQRHCWFGGLTEEVWDGVEAREEVRMEGRDRVTTRTYHTRRGTLTERQRYIFADSTLVRELFTLDAVPDPLGALEIRRLLARRRLVFEEAQQWGTVCDSFSPESIYHGTQLRGDSSLPLGIIVSGNSVVKGSNRRLGERPGWGWFRGLTFLSGLAPSAPCRTRCEWSIRTPSTMSWTVGPPGGHCSRCPSSG